MAELKRLREGAGLTQEEVAGELDWHPTKVMRIETGRTSPHPNDVRVMLGLFGVTDPGQLTGLVKLAKGARQRGWWYSYRDVLINRYEFFIGLESEASTIRDFELAMIPGLLQTEDYARALIRSGPQALDTGEVERRVEVRLTRQQILIRDDRPQFWAIIDEAVIRRVVGGKGVMRSQLASLTAASEQVGTTIQVVPYDVGPHPGLAGPFIILGYTELAEPEVVYMETVGGNLYVDKSEEVRLYTSAFDHLRAVALSPAATRTMLHAAAKELT
ncbi:MAG TPA: helix-turn-helix transcriptional regulator [Streptosporangiaceae bacterium]|jgi:transcriptional regulator with XRE-family HTH domain